MKKRRRITGVAALMAGGSGPPGPPSWVASLRAPSGDYPSIVLRFDTAQYWADNADQTIDSVTYENLNWGNWDPSVAIVPGLGYKASNSYNSFWFTITDAMAAPFVAAGMTCYFLVKNVDGQPFGGNYEGFNLNFFENTFSNLTGVGPEIKFSSPNFPGNCSAYSNNTNPTTSPDVNCTGDVGFAGNVPVDDSGPLLAAAMQGAATADGAAAPNTPTLTNIGGANNILIPGPIYCAVMAIYPLQPETDLPAICALR